MARPEVAMRAWTWLFLVGVLGACGVPDADGDGFGETVDCDDADPAVHPGAVEHCDGVDENCDGEGDLGAVDATTFFADGDGDGHGDLAQPISACALPAGAADNGDDCDDADAGVNPDAAEACDGRDTDCNGLIDDGAGDASTFYVDADGDGYGDLAAPITACAPPLGTVVDATDCDDHQDDTHPGATEWCNGIDDDCDGTADEDDAADAGTWFADGDGDGWGAGAAVVACALPGGVAIDGDCDDGSAAVHPGAAEVCNGVDDDCAGGADVGAVDGSWFYVDFDGDGYGDVARGSWECAAPVGTVANADDCDDYNPANHPGADERCDGVDNNCDAMVDGADAIDPSWWFDDVDGDGWGDVSTATLACDGGPGSVPVPWDCSDDDPLRNPLQPEDCGNGLDDDCDGAIDDCGGGGGGQPTGVYDVGAVAVALWTGSAGDQAGEAGDIVGDMDGDGYDDLVIGGRYADSASGTNVGKVRLIYGGPAPAGGPLSAEITWTGQASDDQHGYEVAGVGDLDGDSYADLAISAAYDGISCNCGTVHLIYGGPVREVGSTLPRADADALFEDTVTQAAFSAALSPAGDIDGDGFDDFVMGQSEYSGAGASGAGAAYLVYGSATRRAGMVSLTTLPRLVGETDQHIAKWDGVGSGDFDGDGLGDLVIGSDNVTTSKAFVVYGTPVRWPVGSTAIAPVSALFTGNWLPDNSSLSGGGRGVGDLNGDGYEDLALRNASWDGLTGDSGLVMVEYGGPVRWSGSTDAMLNAGFTVTGVAFDMMGDAVARATDLDGDGLSDLVASATWWSGGTWAQSGAVAVYYGTPGLTGMKQTDDADLRFEGPSAGLLIGNALGSGDVDGDGLDDLLITDIALNSYGGGAWLISGGQITP